MVMYVCVCRYLPDVHHGHHHLIHGAHCAGAQPPWHHRAPRATLSSPLLHPLPGAGLLQVPGCPEARTAGPKCQWTEHRFSAFEPREEETSVALLQQSEQCGRWDHGWTSAYYRPEWQPEWGGCGSRQAGDQLCAYVRQTEQEHQGHPCNERQYLLQHQHSFHQAPTCQQYRPRKARLFQGLANLGRGGGQNILLDISLSNNSHFTPAVSSTDQRLCVQPSTQMTPALSTLPMHVLWSEFLSLSCSIIMPVI